MEKIDFYLKTAINIPDGNDPRPFNPPLTNLQVAERNTPANKVGTRYFFQKSAPDCDGKYWKISDGEVVEMTQEEKTHTDAVEAYEQKKADFFGYRYFVSVSWAYVSTNYPEFVQWCTGRVNDPIAPIKAYTTADGQSVNFCNSFAPGHRETIEADSNFTLIDIETFNPD